MKQGDVYKSKVNNAEYVVVMLLAVNEANDEGMVIYANNFGSQRQLIVSEIGEFLKHCEFVRNNYDKGVEDEKR